MPTDLLAAHCEELHKTYRTATSEVRALRGITARFPKAALSVVAGPSGSGKSSLLRLLAGLERPTSGTSVVGHAAIHHASQGALRRLRRGTIRYVFQRASDNFFPHLTVEEHLQVAGRAGRSHSSFRRGDLLEILGLEERARHLPSELSGGEQARAAIAQALLGGAGIVVADEPTAELDSDSAGDVIDAMRRLIAHGVTIIVATHDRALIRRADHFLHLDHGVLRGKDDRPAPRSTQGISGRHDGSPRVAVPGSDPADVLEQPVVEMRAVSKSYRRGTEVVQALREASLTLRGGDLVALVGRSGSGKTTLLNVVAGWERPDAGHVAVRGLDPSRSVPSWSDMAVLPQRLGLIDELTIRENVEYPARLAGTLRDVPWLVEALIEALGLSELSDRYPKETSVGEQQRAALARALVLSPRVLLVDEPTGHQDRGWAEAMFGALRRAVDQGTACVAATHDEGVAPFVDTVVTMMDGRLGEATA